MIDQLQIEGGFWERGESSNYSRVWAKHFVHLIGLFLKRPIRFKKRTETIRKKVRIYFKSLLNKGFDFLCMQTQRCFFTRQLDFLVQETPVASRKSIFGRSLFMFHCVGFFHALVYYTECSYYGYVFAASNFIF